MLEPEWKGPEWEDWKRNQQTKEVLAYFAGMVRNTQDQWLNNQFVRDDYHQGVVCNAAALSSAQTIQKFLDKVERIGEGNGSEK